MAIFSNNMKTFYKKMILLKSNTDMWLRAIKARVHFNSANKQQTTHLSLACDKTENEKTKCDLSDFNDTMEISAQHVFGLFLITNFTLL